MLVGITAALDAHTRVLGRVILKNNNPASWDDYKKTRPKISRTKLSHIIKEGILEYGKKFHIGLRVSHPRCDTLTNILDEKDRPMKFSEIVNEARWKEVFELKKNSMNQTVGRLLSFLEHIDIVGYWSDGEREGYYLTYQIIKHSKEETNNEKAISKSLIDDWSEAKGELHMIRRNIEEIKTSLKEFEKQAKALESIDKFIKDRFGKRIY
ncbi:hypothetical protein BMS3Bbin16_00647 [archaeon BMS3Bbin16]|nr:hypothetical protein BMS3Bbin16_00647 [archaeon BMS3Bbin16]